MSRANFWEKQRFISCETGPNTQSDDAWLAFKLFFTSGKSAALQSVTNWFKKYLGQDEAKLWFTDSGRTALYLLLKSLVLPKDAEVLVQGFSCVLVPNSVLQAGYKPVLCDIDEHSYNFDLDKLERKVTTKTRVLIIQHTFGLMPDMDRVQDICRRHDLILIEDVAHALGCKYRGRLAGTFGDGAIFSFGRDKVVTSVMGGLAVINKEDSEWRQNCEQIYQELSRLSKEKERQSLLFTILAGWILPWYHWGVGKLTLMFSLKFKLIPPVYAAHEVKGTDKFLNGSVFSSKLATLLSNQLGKFDKYREHRRQIGQIYSRAFDLDYGEDSVFLRFPLNLEQVVRNEYSKVESSGDGVIDLGKYDYSRLYDRIIFSLRQNGIFAGLWYQSVFIPQQVDLSKFGYRSGDLPVIEKLTKKKILNLPTNIKTSPQDAKRIVQIVKDCL